MDMEVIPGSDPGRDHSWGFTLYLTNPFTWDYLEWDGSLHGVSFYLQDNLHLSMDSMEVLDDLRGTVVDPAIGLVSSETYPDVGVVRITPDGSIYVVWDSVTAVEVPE